MNAAAVHAKAIDLGKLAVEMTTSAGSGHPSTALSLAHLITVLLYRQMRWDPNHPDDPRADRLVLSEGHAVPIVYAALADVGCVVTWPDGTTRPLTRADVKTLRAIDSPLDGHPHPQVGVHFFDAATGSLGQGLSVAAGLGKAARMDGIDRNIYCVIGDGESREGQIWEAVDFLADHALTNVVALFNCNELAQSDWVSPQQSSQAIAAKLTAAGFVVRTIDGHDPEQISRALGELRVIQNGCRPLAIVARTIKGWGAAAEQGSGKHGAAVSANKLAAVLAELDTTGRALGAGGEMKRPDGAGLPPNESRPGSTATPAPAAPFTDAMIAAGFEKALDGKLPIAPRKAYGAAILALSQADRRIVVLDADVKNSTYAEFVARRLPAQFVECRIAEQNMISAAVGLAAAGKIPFCSTFAKFFVRAYDQIEMAVIGGANIKLTGSHAGVTLAADGPSQMSLADMAFFRALAHVKNFNGQPAATVFYPADAMAAYACTCLMARLDGLCYQRTLRADVSLLYKADEIFAVGGHKVLREGKDLLIVAAGYMVHEALAVADQLGRSTAVVDAYSLPLDTQPVLAMAERCGGRVVCLEDNFTGGLASEIAEAAATSGANIKLLPLFVHSIPKSGREPEDVLTFLGLGRASVLEKINQAYGQ